MESITRDLAIGVAGSLIGAILVALFSFSSRWTKLSRERWRDARNKEIEDWASGDGIRRQNIFNKYLFSVLKFFIIGTTLIATANAIGDLEVTDKTTPLSVVDYINALFDSAGVLFYILTLSRIIIFAKLLQT